MNTKRFCCAVAALTLMGSPVLAHHSGAMFDSRKEVTLVGTVKEFQFTNPHSWVEIMVPGPGGKQVQWSIEGARPNDLMRNGWKRNTLKPGDKVRYVIHPARNGSTTGSGIRVTLANGQALNVYAPNQQPR